MTKKAGLSRECLIRHSNIRASFVIPHSIFVILRVRHSSFHPVAQHYVFG
jgi:hypothetical protein